MRLENCRDDVFLNSLIAICTDGGSPFAVLQEKSQIYTISLLHMSEIEFLLKIYKGGMKTEIKSTMYPRA